MKGIMREDILSDNWVKLNKCTDQNQNLKKDGKTNGNTFKTKSNASWGSQIVKGLSMDKKTKPRISVPDKKPPVDCPEISSQKDPCIMSHSRVKRSLISDFPCSANAAQVHPHVFDCPRLMSPSSRDLFAELDHLRRLLRESKERDVALRAELQQAYEKNPRVSELEKELELKRTEIGDLNCKVGSLEAENTNLSEQLSSLTYILETRDESSKKEESVSERRSCYQKLEMEVLELRRLNKELQLQKRNLCFRLSSMESQLAAIAKVTESDIVAKVEAEASVLRHTNENLCKQVEGLQMSRLNEVEELAYLRWVNSCLRQELSNSDKLSSQSMVAEVTLSIQHKSPDVIIDSHIAHDNSPYYMTESVSPEILDLEKAGNVTKTIKWTSADKDGQFFDCQDLLDREWEQAQGASPRRRHSISGPKGCAEDSAFSKRRQSDGFLYPKELDNYASGTGNCSAFKDRHHILAQKYDLGAIQSPRFFVSKQEHCKVSTFDVEKRALRIPNPPPRPSTSVSILANTSAPGSAPPPPPPPPPPLPKFSTRGTGLMQRAPQVAELYHSLMRRDLRKDSSVGGICDAASAADVRSSMIGEIENRSSHLLAIKADVETQGEFVRSLIKEVNDAAYRDIEDVVAFVKWLDDELCFLVDERAVLKHFDWPEKKADALREAAFGYRDLKKLESDVSSYEDNPRLPCDVALKKMASLSEKMESTTYNLQRTRDTMMRHCKEFHIPTDWMLDNGIISKIKFASVKLAMKYMKRVATELQARGSSDKDPALEYMLLQGVRFAFRIHQFAGGFDSETMHAFEELRNLVHGISK